MILILLSFARDDILYILSLESVLFNDFCNFDTLIVEIVKVEYIISPFYIRKSIWSREWILFVSKENTEVLKYLVAFSPKTLGSRKDNQSCPFSTSIVERKILFVEEVFFQIWV